MAGIQNKLAHFRRLNGSSAVKLASVAGVSRQTIYAMEANTYIPNTLVALRLARALNTTVEELFPLAAGESLTTTRTEAAATLPNSPRPSPGDLVELCQVNNRLMAVRTSTVPWCFPLVDATVRTGEPLTVDILDEANQFNERILIAGCDPGISVLARHAQRSGINLVVAHRNSSDALRLLKQGCIHIAGTHLKDAATGESNVPQVKRLFPDEQPAIIAFATWQQGIVTARGNPKHIRSAADFARRDVCLANREKGSGARLLLDSELKREGIKAQQVKGYADKAAGHLAVALRVHSGLSDYGIATAAAARLMGLHFIPLTSERYDFTLSPQSLKLTRIQNLMNILSQQSLRRELAAIGGYDMEAAARRML